MVIVDATRLSDVRPLFAATTPNHPMLLAALLGRTPSVAVADRLEVPSRCVLRTHFGPTFTSQGCDGAFVRDALIELRVHGGCQIVVGGEAPAELPVADQHIARVEFSGLDPDSASITRLVEQTPAECEVRVMSRDLLERCLWRGEVIEALGTIDSFVDPATGLCLVSGNDIQSEAYALFWGEGTVEIGVITHPDFRGMSRAPVTCAHLVRMCARRGFETYWSCEATNAASQSVAGKLGYTRRREYTWLHYDRSG